MSDRFSSGPAVLLLPFQPGSPEAQNDADAVTRWLCSMFAESVPDVLPLSTTEARLRLESIPREDDTLRHYELGKREQRDVIVWGTVRVETEDMLDILKRSADADWLSELHRPLCQVEIHWFDYRVGESGFFYWHPGRTAPGSASLDLTTRPQPLVRLATPRRLPAGRPSRPALDDLEALWQKQGPQRGFLGMEVSEHDAVVTSVLPGSPADQAGLCLGDRITSLGDRTVSSRTDLMPVLAGVAEGEPVAITYVRDGAVRSTAFKAMGLNRYLEQRERARLDTLAPDFIVSTLAGDRIQLRELRGQVVLLHFWATWCGACKASLPTYVFCHERFSRRGLTLLSISEDQDPQTVARFAAANRLPQSVIFDSDIDNKTVRPGPLARLYENAYLPSSVLVDRAGVIREFGWTGVDLIQAVRFWVEVSS